LSEANREHRNLISFFLCVLSASSVLSAVKNPKLHFLLTAETSEKTLRTQRFNFSFFLCVLSAFSVLSAVKNPKLFE